MKVNYAHLCDYASVSVEGKISLMGVFGRIYAAKLPTVHLQAFLAFEVELDYTEVGNAFDVRVECVDADGIPVLKARMKMETEGQGRIGDHPTVPQILRLPPMRFTRPGRHEINIFLGSDPGAKSHVPFDVLELPQSQSPPSLPPV